MTVDEAEQKLIMATLDSAGGNKTRAAEMLGISLKTLHNKLNRFKEDGCRRCAVSAPSCGTMRLSLKQKQVLGVTAMVALIVIALSLLHLDQHWRACCSQESRARFELFANAVYSPGARASSPIAGHRLQRRCAPAASVQSALRGGALFAGRRRRGDRRSDRHGDRVERSGAGRQDRCRAGRS